MPADDQHQDPTDDQHQADNFSIRQWTAQTRADQGLPRHVEDAPTLDKLARMLADDLDATGATSA